MNGNVSVSDDADHLAPAWVEYLAEPTVWREGVTGLVPKSRGVPLAGYVAVRDVNIDAAVKTHSVVAPTVFRAQMSGINPLPDSVKDRNKRSSFYFSLCKQALSSISNF